MIDPTEAEQLAFSFLMAEWDISEEDEEWFTILYQRVSHRRSHRSVAMLD
jgi:hypothetical protein